MPQRSSYLSDAATPRTTPQSEPIPGSGQEKNAAGGYAWELDAMAQLKRWLVLGSSGGSYYATERDLTRANMDAVRQALAAHGPDAVQTIVDVSAAGRAPRNDEAIYALAMACADPAAATRSAALAAISDVCRIGTHLFQFMEFVKGQRGRGRALNRAVGKWYTDKDPDHLAYQLVKYRQRGGWTHGDVLRLVRPKPPTAEHDALFKFATTDFENLILNSTLLGIRSVRAYAEARLVETTRGIVGVIKEYGPSLPREAIMSEHLSDPDVMGALVDAGMPYTALMRNLGNLTRLGVLKALDARTTTVAGQLADPDAVKRSRVHPLNVLKALVTYQAGHGYMGGNTWEPNHEITDALDAAFYRAFANVPATGKRYLLALDVSGSMTQHVAGSFLSARQASAALAMVTMTTGDPTHVVGFSHELIPVAISPKQRLDDAVRTVTNLPFGGTDCSLPMLHALRHDLAVDCFVVLTDSETWAGHIHPAQALAKYRRETGIPARLVVVGMTSGGFTIADPRDAGMLDVVGFDSATPSLIAQFAAGDL